MAYNYMGRAIAAKSQARACTAKHSGRIHVSGAFRRRPLNGASAALSSGNGQDDPTKSQRLVGIIVFDQMTAADLIGPAETFSRAKIGMIDSPSSPESVRDCYQTLTIGIDAKACVTECGIAITPHWDIESAPPLDTIIVPSGSGIHDLKFIRKITKWLVRRAPATRRIAALGAGIYAVAATGLLDGRQVVTHWRFAKDVALRFPKLRVNSNNLFLKDGPFYTSAGATAGIDLSLSLIEEDYGPRIAITVARELVVYLKRSGGQEQYSEPLQFQTQSVSRLSDVATWIVSHLSQDLSVEALAAKACLCPRHFCRRFKAEFGCTPADFVERLRLDEARRRLSTDDNSIENVGLSVGFKSADAFRRAFQRRLEINPNEYRRRFSTAAKTEGDSHRRPKAKTVLIAA
jgi:transcriptional regulator GlxA family with amidase domain